MKATYEFILWPNCHNNCTFCFQKEQLRQGKLHLFSYEDKEKAILDTMLLLGTNFQNGNDVMLTGGELFDDPQIHPLLKDFFDLVAYYLHVGVINELYLNTNLIYKKLEPITHFLFICEQGEVLDKVHFTTSYDFDGRFKNGTEQLMLKHLNTVSRMFSKARIFVNTMLSKTTCERILSGEFSVKSFSERYNCYVNLLPYIQLIPQITASRSLIVQTLQKVDEEIPGYVNDYLVRLDVNQEKHVYCYNPMTREYEYSSCALAECGHSENFRRYSDSGTCYVCDMKRVFGL